MPKLYKRPPVLRSQDDDTLSAHEQCQLEYGRGLFPSLPMMDRQTFDAKWNRHGEKLLADWVKRHPGSRPFAWWINDHGKERPVHPDVPQEFHDDRRRDALFGFLNRSIQMQVAGKWICFQESESDYLARHQLLTDAELDALDRAAAKAGCWWRRKKTR